MKLNDGTAINGVQAVFSGRIFEVLERWQTPLAERIAKSKRAHGKMIDAQIAELAEEMGDRIYHDAMRDGASRPEIVANKFVSQADKDLLTGSDPSDRCPTTARVGCAFG